MVVSVNVELSRYIGSATVTVEYGSPIGNNSMERRNSSSRLNTTLLADDDKALFTV